MKQSMDLDSSPAKEIPRWGRRVVFDEFFVELVPSGPRTLNVKLESSLATISFSTDEGRSSLAGDRLRSYERRPYEYLAVPPKFPVQGRSTSAPEVLCFVFSFEDLRDEIAAALQVPGQSLEPRVIIGGPKPFTTEIAQRIRRLILTDVSPSQYLRSLCIVMLVEIMRLPPEQARSGRSPTLDENVLQMALNYIDANLDQDLSLEALAQLTGVVTHQFARAFKKAIGEPPHHYILSRRIDAARSLLEKADAKISDVAYMTGFSSQSHMTTAFKREIGVTPAQFRSRALR